MHLKPHIIELVTSYRQAEADDRRGPCFKDVALALEREMETDHVTKRMVLDCFGPPDLFDDDHVFVYYFDHEQPGRNKDEWYFHFQNGKVARSGYNERGINDLSRMRDHSQFPTDDA